jgi:hypothetical protein
VDTQISIASLFQALVDASEKAIKSPNRCSLSPGDPATLIDLNAAQGITQLDGHAALKWERHADFFTPTLVVTSSSDELSWTSLPEVLTQKRRSASAAVDQLGEDHSAW